MAVALVLGVVGVSATAAGAAATGSFTKATTDAAWTKGDIAGSVTWDSCPVSGSSRCVYWKPFVLVQPALPSYPCAWQDAFDDGGDRNIRVLWGGTARTSPGASESFALTDAPLLAGVQGQRVCLVAFIPTKVPDQVCINQSKVFEQLGYPPLDCPPIDGMTGEVIDQTLLTEKTDEPPPVDPMMTLTQAVTIAKKKLATKYGRSWRSGTKKSVTCREKSALFTCSAKWSFKKKPKRGSVLVFKP